MWLGRPVSTRRDGIRDSMQSRNFKNKEYFDLELWREINYGLRLRKTAYSQKNS
jgi:hypothetical protein